jgi:hypothetical protein
MANELTPEQLLRRIEALETPTTPLKDFMILKDKVDGIEKYSAQATWIGFGFTAAIVLLGSLLGYSTIPEAIRSISKTKAQEVADNQIRQFADKGDLKQIIDNHIRGKTVLGQTQKAVDELVIELTGTRTSSLSVLGELKAFRNEAKAEADKLADWEKRNQDRVVKVLKTIESPNAHQLEGNEWQDIPGMETEFHLSTSCVVLINFHSGPLEIIEDSHKSKDDPSGTSVYFSLNFGDNRRAQTVEVKSQWQDYGGNVLWVGKLAGGHDYNIKIQWTKRWSNKITADYAQRGWIDYSDKANVRILGSSDANRIAGKRIGVGHSLEVIQFPTAADKLENAESK